MSAKPKQAPCPHDVNELLAKERQYMPLLSKSSSAVWCDECRHWVPFDWVDRPDGKGMNVQPIDRGTK